MRSAAAGRRAVGAGLAVLRGAAVCLALGGLFAAGLAFAGCRGAQPDAERAGAVAYGRAAADVRRLQAEFLAVWKESREAETVAELRRVGEERVLPALGRYLGALESLPVAGERLRTLHEGLFEAWLRFAGQLRLYYEKVTDANLGRRNDRLQSAWVELGARIVAYRERLADLYRALGLASDDLDGATAPGLPAAAPAAGGEGG